MVADNIRKNITNQVKNHLLSLKIDSARNIFGISAQFIMTSQMKSITLGMIELKGANSSTAKNLELLVMKTLQKYNIHRLYNI